MRGNNPRWQENECVSAHLWVQLPIPELLSSFGCSTAQTQGVPEAAQHLLSCWLNRNQNTSSELALLLRALIRACHTTWVGFYRACGGCVPALTPSASNWGRNPSLSLSFYALLHVNLYFLYTYYNRKGKKQVTQVWLLHDKFYRISMWKKILWFLHFFLPYMKL